MFVSGLPREDQRGIAGRLGQRQRVRHRCRWSVDVGSDGILRSLPVRALQHSFKFERSFEIMRPYDERLDHLLARAARVFADKGYHPTTMRDLSAASGMSLAGMYYYVRGKEDLLALIQERGFTQVLDGARQAVATPRDPQEPLQALIPHPLTLFPPP